MYYVCIKQRKEQTALFGGYSATHSVCFTFDISSHNEYCLFVCLVFKGTFSTNRLHRAIAVGEYIMEGQETTKTHNKTMKQYGTPKKS